LLISFEYLLNGILLNEHRIYSMKFIYLALFLSSSAFGQMVSKDKLSPQIISKMDSALTLFKSGNYKQGLSIYDRIIQIEPGNIVILEIKGGWELALKEYNRALQTSLRVIKLEPRVIRYQLRAGSLYLRTGDPVKARPFFEKVIRLSNQVLDTLNSADRDNQIQYKLCKALATIFNGDRTAGNKLLLQLYKYEGERPGAASYQYLYKSKDEVLKVWLGEK
jgi:tetratricopeptide (TPR) repeat protein